MDMNHISRGESRAAQQSRRNKLRVQNSEDLEENYTNNLEQLWAQPGNIKYGATSQEPTCFSSDVISYVHRNESLLSAGNVSVNNNLSHPVSSNLNLSAAKVGDPDNCSNWKSLGSHQISDWIVKNNYNGSNNPTSNSVSGANPMFSRGDGLRSSKVNNISPASVHIRQPNCYGYNQDVLQSSHIVASPSSYNYHNTLQEVVTSANVGLRGQDVVRYGGKDADELVYLPSYNDHDQANQGRSCNASSAVWVNRPVEVFQNWNGEDLADKSVREHMTVGDGFNTRGLSLSLSSASKTHNRRECQFRERNGLTDHPLESKVYNSNYLCSSSRRSVGSKDYGNDWQNTVGIPTIPPRAAAGPLGPLTGYSTILKNSEYLKPTLQLIDELFRVTVTKQIEAHEVYSSKNSDEPMVSAAVHAVNAANAADDSMVRAKDGESGASYSSLYSSNVAGAEAGCPSNAGECYHPDYYQKKTKLLHMQEELRKRNRQYHKQMQMVVASFESVAGLSTAAPYISVALKTVSRHFRSLKQVISEQLRHMERTLRAESSPTAGTTSSIKCDASTSGLRLTEHQKPKSCGSAMILFEPHQPVWRPQRGLPERAVAVLRAWLFEHFLHPYPTDTDKHMLATQTGLTRNQVSNWFINARVRVWKPMVEEIHILETKGSAESSSQMGKPDGNAASDVATNQYNIQPINKLCGIDSSKSRGMTSAEVWNQEKRSRHEFQIPAGINAGSLMSFIPYQQGGLEIGSGLGAVSLTLGLRQSAESAHQQQHDQYRQHFGGHMIHDYVG